MSLETLTERVGEVTDRRRFLRRVGVGGLAVVLGFLGITPEARALVYYKCCELCRSPGGCSRDPICIWCWDCCHNGYKWRCCEYFSASWPCNRSCTNVYCSTATDLGSRCSGTAPVP